ncbi:hypothetical protein V6N12_046609 [Hibiscus sabdariffa]|uniref:Uncharacterized protein n=1 Tax=Hibiscus sabdariffa TaxID=183260 RepID=A0ABR2DKR2_9ROSI
MRSYQHKCTGSHQISAVKRAWASVVLGWVTSWEVLLLHPYFWFGNGRFSDIALVGAAYKDGVMYGSSKFVTQEMTGAIIPALMHRIPSELRSQACLGESSTRMGDLLGSPRVAPLFLNFAVKRAWARVVLGWVTSWEVLVLHPYFWFGNGRFSEIALVGAAYKYGVMYGSSKFVTQEMTDAIILALMHRIPSELRTLVGAAYKDGVMQGSSKFVTQEMMGAIIPALMHQIPSELRTLVGAAYKDGVMYGSSKFVTQEITGAIIPALMHRIPSELRTLVGAAYKDEVMYGSSKFVTQDMTGAIIPALMHRIPSKLRC